MGIRYQHTPVALVGKLAKLAGESQAAQKEQQRLDQQVARAQVMKFDRQMTEFQANLDIQAGQRAKVWELQKAEAVSQSRLQQSLQEDSIYRNRQVQKQMEREEGMEKALKAWIEVNGDPRTATGAVKEAFDQWYPNLVARTYGLNVPLAPQPKPVSYEKQWREWEAAENLKSVGALPGVEGQPSAEGGIPEPKTTEEFNAIRPGQVFINTNGEPWIKQ